MSRTRSPLVVLCAYFLISLLFFARPLINGLLIAHGDGLVYYYPPRAFYKEIIHAGFSDWNTYNFLGYSLSGSMQGGVYYPLNLIYAFIAAPVAFNFGIILHYALAAFFTYLLCRARGRSGEASFIGGATFAFAGFLMAHRGHVAMMNTGVWLPLVLYLYERFRQSGRWHYVFGGGLTLAVQVTAGYFAVVAYTGVALVLYAALAEWLFGDRNLRAHCLGLAAIFALGMVAAAPQFYSTFITYKNAWRSGFDYYFYTAGSFPPFMLLSFIYPFLFGGGYNALFISPWNVVELSGFVGALATITALVLISMRWRTSPEVKLWSVFGIFVLLAMFNRFTPFGGVLYHLPVYNIFRYHGRFVIALDLALAVLFALAIDMLVLDRQGLRAAYKRIATVAACLIFAGFAISTMSESVYPRHIFDEPGLGNYFNATGVRYLRTTLPLTGPVIGIPILFLTGIIGLFSLLRYRAVSRPVATAGIMLFVLAEQYSFSLYYDTNWPKISEVTAGTNKIPNPVPAIQFVNDHVGHQRYFSLGQFEHYSGASVTGGLFSMLDHKSSLNGIEPLVTGTMNRVYGFFPNGVSNFSDHLLNDNLTLSLAAVRYIIVPASLLQRTEFPRAMRTNESFSGLARVPLAFAHGPTVAETTSGEYLLAPRKQLEISVGGMLEAPVLVEPGARYFVRLEARVASTADSLPPSNVGAVTVDLLGANFDSEAARLRLYSTDLTTEYKSFLVILEVAAQAPPSMVLRVYNVTGYTLAVRNIELSRVEDTRLPVAPEAQPQIAANGNRPYRAAFVSDHLSVIENLNARPRMFCAPQIVPSDGPDDMLKALLTWQVNPATQALVRQQDSAALAAASGGCGSVEIRTFSSGDVEAAVSFAKPGLVVFSEQWDPRWHAYLDGVETPIYQVDFFAQGVVVRPGARTLRFRYQPWKRNYSVAGPLLFAGLWLAIGMRERRGHHDTIQSATSPVKKGDTR